MPMIRQRRSLPRKEQGAIAIITALSMVALCVVAGMVVDLGLIRVDQQSDRSAADAAAMAGANGLMPDTSNRQIYPFAGVCQAMHYLQVNDPDFTAFKSRTWYDGSGTSLGVDDYGCSSAVATLKCVPNTPTSWARLVGISADGKTRVTIQSGYTFAGSGFTEDTKQVYTSDSGASNQGGCDQLAVIMSVTRSTTLARPAASTMGTTVRSVARLTIEPPESPYSLLILERHDCQVITNGNNGVAAINVQGYEDHPGLIHSDSDGTGSNCNKPILVGQKVDGIVAHEAPDNGAPGVISTVATSNQSDGIANVYSGPSPGTGPVTTGLATRKIVDDVYLAGVTAARNSAAFAWNAIATGTAPDPSLGAAVGPWTVLSGCPSGTVTATKILIKNCSNMNNSATFTNATDIIFPGQLGGGSSTIKMPYAQNVYVAGNSTPNGSGITVGTQVSMHDAGYTPDPSTGVVCPAQYDSSASARRGRLFVYAGALTVGGGTFRACNTTVILMSNRDDACLPTGTPTYIANDLPCGGTAGNGIVSMSGGGHVDWTAPNLVDDEQTATDTDHYNLEDLALWTEAGGTQGLGGTGVVHLAGVFVAPNAKPLKLNGNPTWSVLNSQYVVRTLENDGGAIFNMQPSPTLPVAPPNVTFGLVR